MKRKMLPLGLVLAACLMLSGCGGTESTGSQPGTNEPTQKEEESGGSQQAATEARDEYLASITRGSEYSVADSFAGGSGTKDSPYEISTVEELARIEYLCNATVENREEVDYLDSRAAQEAYYVLTSDIQMNDVSDYDNWGVKAPEFGWDAISDFRGHFDGQGHSIIGLYATPRESSNGIYYTGFIKDAGSDAVIENVTFEKAYLTGIGKIAGVVCDGRGVQIRNCNVDATIVGARECGGIITDGNECIVDSCTFTGSINDISSQGDDIYWSSFSNAGGIIGRSSGSVVTDCTSDGIIHAKNSTVGGIAGTVGEKVIGLEGAQDRYPETLQKLNAQASTGVFNCTFNGEVYGGTEVGGICGNMFSFGPETADILSIEGCVNNGSITLNSDPSGTGVGGICGSISSASKNDGTSTTFRLKDCKNNGDVTGTGEALTSNVGGILGSCSMTGGSVEIKGCSNDNKIESTGNAGGIMGHMSCLGSGALSMESLTNNGSVKGGNYVGGIGGNVTCAPWEDNQGVSLTLKDCHNYADVSGGTMGGIFGAFMPGIKKDSPIGSYDIANCTTTGDMDLFGSTDSIEVLQEKLVNAIHDQLEEESKENESKENSSF